MHDGADGSAARPAREAPDYQMRARFAASRTIASPSLQLKAFANSSSTEGGPFARQWPDECGLVRTC